MASEVRKLTERSRIAANEINILSKDGIETINNAGEQFEEIVPEIDRTSKLVKEISIASNEQSAGINKIVSSIQTLNQVTQHNAAASEKITTSIKELTNQFIELNARFNFFNVGDLNRRKQTLA